MSKITYFFISTVVVLLAWIYRITGNIPFGFWDFLAVLVTVQYFRYFFSNSAIDKDALLLSKLKDSRGRSKSWWVGGIWGFVAGIIVGGVISMSEPGGPGIIAPTNAGDLGLLSLLAMTLLGITLGYAASKSMFKDKDGKWVGEVDKTMKL